MFSVRRGTFRGCLPGNRQWHCKRIRSRCKTGCTNIFFQKFPVTFDQIQVRRVARKENQLNPQQSGKRPDPVTSLVRCIVQNHLDDEGQVYASSS